MTSLTSMYEPLGRALVVLLFVYLTTFVLGLYLDMFGLSLPPLVALLVGFGLVYLGLSYYFYQNPEAEI